MFRNFFKSCFPLVRSDPKDRDIKNGRGYALSFESVSMGREGSKSFDDIRSRSTTVEEVIAEFHALSSSEIEEEKRSESTRSLLVRARQNSKECNSAAKICGVEALLSSLETKSVLLNTRLLIDQMNLLIQFSKESDLMKKLQDKHAIDVVTNVLKKNSEQDVIVEQCILFFSYVVCEENAGEMIQTGLLHDILQVESSKRDTPQIVNSFVKFMSNLARMNISCLQEVCSVIGFELIQLLKAYYHRHQDILVEILRLLNCISNIPSGMKYLGRERCMFFICDAAKTFCDDETVTLHATSLVSKYVSYIVNGITSKNVESVEVSLLLLEELAYLETSQDEKNLVTKSLLENHALEAVLELLNIDTNCLSNFLSRGVFSAIAALSELHCIFGERAMDHPAFFERLMDSIFNSFHDLLLLETSLNLLGLLLEDVFKTKKMAVKYTSELIPCINRLFTVALKQSLQSSLNLRNTLAGLYILVSSQKMFPLEQLSKIGANLLNLTKAYESDSSVMKQLILLFLYFDKQKLYSKSDVRLVIGVILIQLNRVRLDSDYKDFLIFALEHLKSSVIIIW